MTTKQSGCFLEHSDFAAIRAMVCVCLRAGFFYDVGVTSSMGISPQRRQSTFSLEIPKSSVIFCYTHRG